MSRPTVKIVVTEASGLPRSRLDSSEEAQKAVQKSGVHGCVAVSHNPSVQVYFALRKKIEESEDEWLDEFLRLDGLDSLLDSLCHMTGRAFTNFSDAILMLDCVSCIRSVLNRQIGIEFVLQRDEDHSLLRKLVSVLDSGNTLPKKQVFEMLAVVSVYGNRGYRMVIDALRHFKRETNQSHEFSVIVNELKDADTVPYKTAILTLINCVLMGTHGLVERCRFRTELEGLQLLDVLSFLRKEDSDEDLSIQLEKFHVKKHEDEVELERETRINMTDPHQLTREIMKKIFGSAKESCLVQILQDLLFLSTARTSLSPEEEDQSDVVWNTLKKAVHHLATDKRHLSFIVDPKEGEVTPASSQSPVCSCRAAQRCSTDTATPKNKQNPVSLPGTVVTRARRLFEGGSEKPLSPALVIKNHGRLQRHQPLARPPNTRLKTLRWVPIFPEDMQENEGSSVWERLDARETVLSQPSELESMFADNSHANTPEVQLLEPGTRLQVNLYLERLETGVDDLVTGLSREDHLPVGLTNLRCLSQVLPPPTEVAALRKYSGHRDQLGLAEQFLLYLSDVSHYHVLLEGHLTRAEFTSSLTKLKSSLKAQTEACQEILDNTSLAKFFFLILDVGNFLNYDKFNGGATGFKLSTLSRLNCVRSNVPNKTLLHLIVRLAQDSDDSMLQFLTDFHHLDKASRLSLEEIKTEVNEMNSRLRKLIQKLARASQHVRNVFELFLEDVRQDFANFQTELNNLRQLSHRVAVYFCENEADFSLQECFKELLAFCRAVRKCREENTLFGKQQRLAVGRMSQLKTHVRNRRISLEFGKEAGASSSFVEERGAVLENLLTEIHRGNFRPLVPSGLTTPDQEDRTFCGDLAALSPIQVFSPCPTLRPLPPIASVETLNDFTLVNGDPDATVYDQLAEYQDPVDIVPQAPAHHEGEYYCKPLSFGNPWVRPSSLGPLPALPVSTPSDVPGEVTHRPRKTHHRSRSDLLEVSSATEKWVRYEKGKSGEYSQVNRQTDNHRNSAIYSMDLEDKGSLKHPENIYLPAGPVMVLPGQETGEEPFKRTKNRSSLRNFLNKISGSKNRAGVSKEKGGGTVTAKGKRKEETTKVTVGEYMKSDKENTVRGMKIFSSQRGRKGENILKVRNK